MLGLLAAPREKEPGEHAGGPWCQPDGPPGAFPYHQDTPTSAPRLEAVRHAMISWSGGCPSGRETWSPDHTPIPQMASQRPVVRHSDALRDGHQGVRPPFRHDGELVLGSRWLQWMSPGGRPGGRSVDHPAT